MTLVCFYKGNRALPSYFTCKKIYVSHILTNALKIQNHPLHGYVWWTEYLLGIRCNVLITCSGTCINNLLGRCNARFIYRSFISVIETSNQASGNLLKNYEDVLGNLSLVFLSLKVTKL